MNNMNNSPRGNERPTSRRQRLASYGPSHRRSADPRQGSPLASSLFGLSLLGAVVFGGCTESSAPDEAVDAPIPPSVQDVDLTDFDTVIRMTEGDDDQVDGIFPEAMGVASGRHLLSLETPDGLADLFALEVQPPDGTAVQNCTAIVLGGPTGLSCGELPGVGLVGSQQAQTGKIYDFQGPADMTHFVVNIGGQRQALVPVEGRALLWSDQPGCDGVFIESAWRGDAEISVDHQSSC